MEIGVVLPAALPGVSGSTVLEWARLADESRFSTVAVPDRLDYQNYEPLLTLAAVASAASHVRLATTILLAPERPAPWLAKEVATLSQFASGRLVLGIGVGARPIDYEVAGVPWRRRGAILDEQLELLDRMRRPADPVQDLGPPPLEFPILIGGASKGALARLVRWGDGYISGGVSPQIFQFEVAATRGAWQESGRDGEPRIVAGTWYASEARLEQARANLEAYFIKGGPPPQIRDEIRCGRDAVLRAVEEFAALGAQEVIFNTMVTDVGELEWLIDAVAEVAERPTVPA